MSGEQIPVVVYGVKSSPDENESVDDQHRQVRAQLSEGRFLVAEPFGEEKTSGYRKSRGPELEAAMRAAVQAAAEHGHAELWVFHSSRLARGSGRKDEARSLLEVFTQMRRAGVTLRSVSDDLYVTDEAAIGMAAKMANKYSEDLSAHVTRGLRKRAAEGKPVGTVPLGYVAKPKTVNGEVVLNGGKVVHDRVPDPKGVALVERIFSMIEQGLTFGEVARILNAEGIQTKRGNPWVSRSVSVVIHNRAYVGEKGYEEIIDPDRFEAVHANLKRLDPVMVAKRKGARKADESYFLHGIARCLHCGSALYCRRYAAGRVYICRHRLLHTGVCDASPVPALLLEGHVIRHLDGFVGSVEDWLAERVDERDGERKQRQRALDRLRAQTADLDRKRDRHVVEYEKLVAKGASTASIALEIIEKINRERDEHERAIEQAEAVLSEWSGPPDVNAALDFYNRLVDHVQGRIKKAEGAHELNAALTTVVAGLWALIEDDQLRVEFELVHEREFDLPEGVVKYAYGVLPPRDLADDEEPAPIGLSDNPPSV
jgi:site-specific DNA recombinase